MGIIVIVLIILCVVFFFTFWYVTIPITIAIVAAVVAYKKKKTEIAAREAEAEADRMRKAIYEETQRQLQTDLANCVSESVTAGSEIRREIEKAEMALSQAEHEFSEGMFAPFWDAVEKAVNHLTICNFRINTIIENSSRYSEGVMRLDSNPPAFRIDINTLPDTAQTAARMRAIVRRAQKDFHFATIYEQRKTNMLLTAGFSNLAEALNCMSDRIESSINSLSDALSDIAETNCANTEELIASIRQLHETTRAESSSRRAHEEKQREMLDNIQRGRRPPIINLKTI